MVLDLETSADTSSGHSAPCTVMSKRHPRHFSFSPAQLLACSFTYNNTLNHGGYDVFRKSFESQEVYEMTTKFADSLLTSFVSQMNKNKEKEKEKQKEREIKDRMKTDYSQGASGAETYYKGVNERDADAKKTSRDTVKGNEKVNIAKAFYS